MNKFLVALAFIFSLPAINPLCALSQEVTERPLYGETIKHGTQLRENDRLLNAPLYLSDELSEENGWIDITPEYFKFNTSRGDSYTTPQQRMENAELYQSIVSTRATQNLDGFKGYPLTGWTKSTAIGNGTEDNPDYDLSKGMIFLSGGSVHPHYTDGSANNNKASHGDQREIFKSGVSMLDFGDQVGNVWMFNGARSQLLDTLLLGYYYQDSFDENTVRKASQVFRFNNNVDASADVARIGDYTLVFFPIDPVKYRQAITSGVTHTIRLQAEFNTFTRLPNNTRTAMGDITGILDNYGDVIRSDRRDTNYSVVLEGVMNDDSTDFVIRGASYSIDDDSYATSPRDWNYFQKVHWDATTWMLYEANLTLEPSMFNTSPIEMIDGIPCVRVQFPAVDLNNVAYFLRNVRVFIKEGDLGNIESGSPVRITKNTYLLRPKDIFVKTKKLFVNEPDNLEGIVKPTWATRDIRWVLVGNDGKQYRTVDDPDLPSEIADYISDFDQYTGAITAKRNGSVLVQAISMAEGVGPDGLEVRKVMSAVTRLPIYNVIHKIDINHLHHAVDEAEGSDKVIQLSANESTRVEYVLKTLDDLSLSDGISKFDPETVLGFSVNGSDYTEISHRETEVGALHGFTYKNYAVDDYPLPHLYEGTGVFDIKVVQNASINKDSKLCVRVDDGRENWEMYNGDPRFAEGQRDGIAIFHHYAEPVDFVYEHNYHRTYDVQQLNSHHIAIALKASDNTMNKRFEIDVLAADEGQNSETTFQNWEVEDNSDDSVIVEVENGKLYLTPVRNNLKNNGTHINLRTYYAGAFKSLKAETLEGDEPSLSILADNATLDWRTNEDNKDFTIFNLYDSQWEQQWDGSGNADHPRPLYDHDLRIDVYDIITTSIDDVMINAVEISPVYFTLQGLPVDKPSVPGIYICKRGSKVEKIVIGCPKEK